MKHSTQHCIFICLIIISGIGICVKGKILLVQVPPNPLYVPTGGTAKFVWDYVVDNRTEEFQINSPAWKYKYANGTTVTIGYEHFFQDWKLVVSFQTCPSRLLNPTIRVSKESKATLVISNVTTSDSGIYGMDLLLKASHPITSRIKLIVTTRPKFTSNIPSNMTILEGQGLNISCSATGIPTPNVSWVLVKGQTKQIKRQGVGYADLFIKNITRYQGGTYQCQATNNPNEYPVENELQVTIWYKPNITVLNWTVGGKLISLCQASGKPHPSITWYYPSGIQVVSGITKIEGGIRMVLEISDSNASYSLYGLYKCNATNQVGWQVGSININHTNRPTTTKVTQKAVTVTSKSVMKTQARRRPTLSATTLTRMNTKKSLPTSNFSKNGTTEESGQEQSKDKINIKIVALLCVFGAVLAIAVTISLILVLRKFGNRENNKENDTDSPVQNNAHLHYILPEASNTGTYAEVRNIAIYAQIGMPKKNRDRQDDNIPIYAQVDKKKKTRPSPGQVIYAELENIKPSSENRHAILPPPYIATDYADIKNHGKQAQVFLNNPEPIYETLPESSF